MTGGLECNGKQLLFLSRLWLLSLANQISGDAQLAPAVGSSGVFWGQGLCPSGEGEGS